MFIYVSFTFRDSASCFVFFCWFCLFTNSLVILIVIFHTHTKHKKRNRKCVVSSWPRPCSTHLLCSIEMHERTRGRWEDELCPLLSPNFSGHGTLTKCSWWTADQWAVKDNKELYRAAVAFPQQTALTICLPFLSPHLICLHAVLQLKLQQRRTREELVSQGIMPRKFLV